MYKNKDWKSTPSNCYKQFHPLEISLFKSLVYETSVISMVAYVTGIVFLNSITLQYIFFSMFTKRESFFLFISQFFHQIEENQLGVFKCYKNVIQCRFSKFFRHHCHFCHNLAKENGKNLPRRKTNNGSLVNDKYILKHSHQMI